MPFHVYKKVLQLFFINYEKTNYSQIVSFKKMLNVLLNFSKNEFISFKANPDRTGIQNFSSFLEQYDCERDDYLIAGNAFLTLIRSNALELNLEPGLGHKIIKHNPEVIKSLIHSIHYDSIVELKQWIQLGDAKLSGAFWCQKVDKLKQMWDDQTSIKPLYDQIMKSQPQTPN